MNGTTLMFCSHDHGFDDPIPQGESSSGEICSLCNAKEEFLRQLIFKSFYPETRFIHVPRDIRDIIWKYVLFKRWIVKTQFQTYIVHSWSKSGCAISPMYIPRTSPPLRIEPFWSTVHVEQTLGRAIRSPVHQPDDRKVVSVREFFDTPTKRQLKRQRKHNFKTH